MKILIACEFSGIVRDAFIKKEHNAISCDLLPTELPGPHIQRDVLDILNNGWDMIIAFPPCTHLAVSGARWFKNKQQEQKDAIGFFLSLVTAPIERIAIENPIGIMSTIYRKPDQIIQPWMFGHSESKSTCLWLKGLSQLEPTQYAEFNEYRCRCGNILSVESGKYGCCDYPAKPLWDNQTKSGQNKLTPNINRWKNRSKTYLGIANAMADQWG